MRRARQDGYEAPTGRCSYVVRLIDPVDLTRIRTLRRIPTGGAYASQAKLDEAIDYAQAYVDARPTAACQVDAEWHVGGKEVDSDQQQWMCCGTLAAQAAELVSRGRPEAEARALLEGRAGAR